MTANKLQGYWNPSEATFYVASTAVSSEKLLSADAIETLGELSIKKVRLFNGEPDSLLALTSSQLVDFLALTEQRGSWGDSLVYFERLTAFTLNLVTRGLFFPTIKKTPAGDLASSWRLLFRGEESVLDLFLAAAPAILANPPYQKSYLNFSKDEIVLSFIQEVGETVIRESLGNFKPVDASNPNIQSINSQWLNSLGLEQRELVGEASTLRQFESRFLAWQGKILPATTSRKINLGFRIIPPEDRTAVGNEDNEDWYFQILIKNESGYQQIEKFWLSHLNQTNPPPNSENTNELEQQIVTTLSAAAEIFFPLRKIIGMPIPSESTISTSEAYYFLRFACKELVREGFHIELPAWWNTDRQTFQLTLNLDDSDDAGPYDRRLAMGNLLSFRWGVAVGERELSSEEFEDLVKKSSGLVRFGGQWIELSEESAKESIAFLSRFKGRRSMNLLEALRLGSGVDIDDSIIPVARIFARGIISKLFDTTVPDPSGDILVPKSFKGSLRPYQLDGLRWLNRLSGLGIGGCLADDMGLGKTIQFLAFILSLKETATDPLERKQFLLVVPMSILGNWEREIGKFAPSLTTYVHHGASRLSKKAFFDAVAERDIVLTTYSLAFRDKEHFEQIKWSGLVLDEAQNIKNPETKQSIAIRELSLQQMSLSGDLIRFALTGTPIENNLEELWTIFDFLNPGLLGTLRQFRKKFCKGGPTADIKQNESLARLLKPFVLRRLKSDPTVISDLPEKIEIDELLTLTAEQAALYQATLDEMIPQLTNSRGIHRKGAILSTITKLKQICNDPSLLLGDPEITTGKSQKIIRLEELLEEILAEGDKVLIFTQYAKFGDLVSSHLRKRFNQEVLFFHGKLTQKERTLVIDRFQSPSGPAMIVLSLKAGGFGLNLTEANQVIHLDQWWNPAVLDQATDRAFRIGQTKLVQVRKLITKGTLEEKINEMLKEKRHIADTVIRSSKEIITELTDDELFKLLELN